MFEKRPFFVGQWIFFVSTPLNFASDGHNSKGYKNNKDILIRKLIYWKLISYKDKSIYFIQL